MKINQKLVEKIKTKKYSQLDDKIIIETLNKILIRNPKFAKKLNEMNERSAEFKKIIKTVKQELHRPYAAFQTDISKRKKLFIELEKNKDNDKIFIEIKNKILKTHSSTRERLEFYDAIKQDFSEYLRGKIILDLGSGLNPLMFDENKIIAVEFNKEDVKLLNEYFKIKNEKQKKRNNKNSNDDSNENENNESKAILLDLTKEKDIEKLKNIKTDVAFAWKLFDILDTKTTEKIVKCLNANSSINCLIASFSTKTLGNKEMNFPRRGWFQKMLRRLNLNYTTKQYENELFYFVDLI